MFEATILKGHNIKAIKQKYYYLFDNIYINPVN